MENKIPNDISIEDIKVRIRSTSKNPNIGNTRHVVLKNGPRTYKIATIFEIVDPAEGKLHHLSLQLDSIDKSKQGWRTKPEKTFRLEGEKPNEIQALAQFLNTCLSEQYPDKAGEYHLVPEAHYELLSNLCHQLPKLNKPRKLEILTELLKTLETSDLSVENAIQIFSSVTSETVKNIGVAARYVQYREAFREFRNMVERSEPSESSFQNHLKNHPWIFGSEYSELLDRRTWTRDDNLDFMLRRTVDGYLEIIEIKTPFSEPLFKEDKSHDSFYPSSKLSQAIGQVLRYIEEIERKRDSLIAEDHVDPLKIRARIIIGRDGNAQGKAALRTFNSHLHRVEIITFDQLLCVGERTLEIFKSELETNPYDQEEGGEEEVL